MSRILITGATGFLGRRISHSLAAAGYPLLLVGRGVSALETLRANLAADTSNANCLINHYDIRNPDSVELTQIADYGCTRVVHCASPVPGRVTNETSDSTRIDSEIRSITDGLLKTLTQMTAIRHFVLLSTTSVYADQTAGLVTETSPLSTAKVGYAAAKIDAEIRVREFTDTIKRQTALTILRPCQVFGPGEPHGRSLAALIRNACSGRQVILCNGGADRRDFLFISDVGQIVCEVVKRKMRGVFNVGSGSGHTMYEVAEALKSVCPTDFSLIITGESRTPNGVVASTEALRRQCPTFTPTTLEEALLQCCNHEIFTTGHMP